MRQLNRPMLIGISARVMPPAAGQEGIRSKTLDYVERSVGAWIMASGALAVLIPAGARAAAGYAAALDGLILQGGTDVAPETYGATPLHADWAGERVRDVYELSLLRSFVAAGKPVFGICRGAQLINVAFGGTLYQDLDSELASGQRHRDSARYDQHFHDLLLAPDGYLARLYAGQECRRVNSIHHQAVRTLGKDLVAEAHAESDMVVEAIRWNGPSYVLGVQWHPEFGGGPAPLMDSAMLARDFLNAAQAVAHNPNGIGVRTCLKL